MHQNYPYIALGVVALIFISALFYFLLPAQQSCQGPLEGRAECPLSY